MKQVNLGTHGLVGTFVAQEEHNVNEVLNRLWQWQEFNLNVYQQLNVTFNHEPYMVVQDIS